MIRRVFLLILTIITTTSAWADDFAEIPDVKALFEEAEVEGTFVLYDLGEDKLSGYNGARANKQFIPA